MTYYPKLKDGILLWCDNPQHRGIVQVHHDWGTGDVIVNPNPGSPGQMYVKRDELQPLEATDLHHYLNNVRAYMDGLTKEIEQLPMYERNVLRSVQTVHENFYTLLQGLTALVTQ
jgi:hypothetical protein